MSKIRMCEDKVDNRERSRSDEGISTFRYSKTKAGAAFGLRKTPKNTDSKSQI